MYLCNSREDYYASGVTMYTILNISRCLIILWFVMLATDTKCQTTNKPCVDLQLTSGSEDDVVQETEDGDVHITFVISDNCTGSSTRALVKLSTQGADLLVDFCTVYFQNNTCNVTDKPLGHHCIKTELDRCSVSWKVKTTDKLLKLRLTNIITKEEKVISLNITGPPSKKRGTAEIIGISVGVLVAVITVAVLIRTMIFRGGCSEKPVTEHSSLTTWHVSVRQTHRNTGTSRSQAKVDIQSPPGSRGGNAQNETANGNEGERTSKKSDSSTSSPGQAAGNGSKSGGSTPRSSSSGSDKPSTNPNYTSTALQEVEIHPYMDLHTRDPTYASTTSSKDPHMYMELKTLKALQPGSEKNGNDGYETPQVPGQANKSSDGYETPQPPREGRRRSATYANQGVPADPIQEEVNYYNEA